VITLGLPTRLSALEVLHNICNIGTYDLPYMYALGPWAAPFVFGHTYQANYECPYYNYKIQDVKGAHSSEPKRQ